MFLIYAILHAVKFKLWTVSGRYVCLGFALGMTIMGKSIFGEVVKNSSMSSISCFVHGHNLKSLF
jgi:hypothetical protein